jgi:hypothetical protein
MPVLFSFSMKKKKLFRRIVSGNISQIAKMRPEQGEGAIMQPMTADKVRTEESAQTLPATSTAAHACNSDGVVIVPT